MKTSDFDYDLPEELIAQTPSSNRDGSRLLVLEKETGVIRHRRFPDLLEELDTGDVLVLNDSRVIPARLMCRRDTGTADIELLLLRDRGDGLWEVLVRPGRKAGPGTVLHASQDLTAEVLEVLEGGVRLVQLTWHGDLYDLLDHIGSMPLPPYIHERLAQSQQERYQTVYARHRGSAAAPTAGLHFTQRLLDRAVDNGLYLAHVTLHVGLGTFRPVKVEDVTTHHMHAEWCEVSRETADVVNAAKARGNRVVAVGTTSCRTLESMCQEGQLQAGSRDTELFIYPPYRMQMVDALVTNFHLPQSTLLMLVSALAGREHILDAYREAVRQRYRFFSFGDAMLIV